MARRAEPAKKDFVWSYVGYILNFSISIFLLPFVLRSLPKFDLGVWYTFVSVSSLVSVLDLGFANTLIRNTTYAWGGAKKLYKDRAPDILEKQDVNIPLFLQVFRTNQTICLIIGCVAALISLTGGSVYIAYVARESANLMPYLLAWAIYALAISTNFYYNYWVTTLKGVGGIASSQKAIAFAKAVQFVLSLLGLRLGFGLLALSVAYLASNFVMRQICKRSLKNFEGIGVFIEDKSIKVSIEKKKEMFHIMWYNVKRAAAASFSSAGALQCITLLSSGVFGVDYTAEYGLCLQLVTTVTSVAQIPFQTNVPFLTQSILNKDKERERSTLSGSLVGLWGVSILAFVVLILFGNPLLGLIRSNTMLNTGMFAFMAAYTLLEANYSECTTFIALYNELPFVKSAVVSSLITIVVSCLVVFLFPLLGIWPLLIIRCLVYNVYINWRWPLDALRRMNAKVTDIIKYGAVYWLALIKSFFTKQPQ